MNLNVGQRYLWECWQDFTSRIPKRLDALVLVGDLVHGKNPAESGAELVDVDPEWQMRAAYKLLEPVAHKSRAVYAVRGSTYHVGETGRWEEQLVRQLGAKPNAWGHHARTWLHLDLGGVLLDIAHRQSIAMVNQLMPLERELRYALIRSQSEEQKPPDLVVRAHVHTYKWACIDGMLGLSLPAWKMPGSHVETSISPNRKRSRLLGSVLLTIAPERKPGAVNAEDYIHHELLWYRMPALEVVSGTP